jgi:hypothetical protein
MCDVTFYADFFVKDGRIQTGELINIANESASGEYILTKKLKKNGWGEGAQESIQELHNR